MYCSKCGKELDDSVQFCPDCGNKTQNNNDSSVTNVGNRNVSDKSRLITALLCFFLGGLGIHRFYVGKTGTGVLQILLTLCFGIGCVWALIDLVVILCGNFKDKDEKIISNWEAKY